MLFVGLVTLAEHRWVAASMRQSGEITRVGA
jgi:hypothetical protein